MLNWDRKPAFVPPCSNNNTEDDSSEDSDNYCVHDESNDIAEQPKEQLKDPEPTKIFENTIFLSTKLNILKEVPITKQYEVLKFHFSDEVEGSNENIDDIVKKLPTPYALVEQIELKTFLLLMWI